MEIKCEIITRPYGQLEKNMFSLLNLLQKENELYLHIVEYNDLICDTNKQLVWMYDPKNKQSFRINKNKVEEKLADGLVLGRQMAPYKE